MVSQKENITQAPCSILLVTRTQAGLVFPSLQHLAKDVTMKLYSSGQNTAQFTQDWALNYEHFGISCMPIGQKCMVLW